MLFNDLLVKEKIDQRGVLLLRHTPRKEEPQLRKVLPWLAAEHPKIFNAYQQTQSATVEADMLKAKYVASFIGLEKRRGSAEHAAVFIGLYKVGDHRPLTYKQFWEKSEFQELKKFGMRGFIEGERPSLLWFDLTLTDFYKKWQGKLVIDWPRPPIRFWRFASNAEFPVGTILEDSALREAMPDWKDCIWSWAELSKLPSKWRETLRQWRGIYYIFDESDGKGYVGSAYGKDRNLLGRWEHYAATGHGGNTHLRKRSAENLIFSILERVSPDMEKNDVIERESTWKKRLHTMWPSWPAPGSEDTKFGVTMGPEVGHAEAEVHAGVQT